MFEIGEYRAVLKVISRLQALNSQEIDWQILDALVDHAAEFAFHCYEVFDMGLLTRCEEYCRAKRSKFVGKFIDIVNELVRSQGHKLQLSN